MMKHTYFTYPILLITLLSLLPVGTASGQEITISQSSRRSADDVLWVDMDIVASGLDVSCAGAHRLELFMVDDDHLLMLPEVVYTSQIRHRYTRRRVALSGQYRQKPYKVFSAVKPDKTYSTHYRVAVPYAAWMEKARLGYRHLQYTCSGELDLAEGLLDKATQPVEETPVIEQPATDPGVSLHTQMICFLTPQVEAVKLRHTMLTLHIGYPVNVYDIQPDFRQNRHELNRVDSLMTAVLHQPLITVTDIHVKGYASPDGTYTHNEFLARHRADGFKRYLEKQYPIGHLTLKTDWVAEDWEGVVAALYTTPIPYRDEVLRTIENNMHRDPDSREWLIKKIAGGEARRRMLELIYPKLRRIEMKVDYQVAEVNDQDALSLIFTNPCVLSLDEMFRVALKIGARDPRYGEVFRIAAVQYPDNVIANNNAAAACLMEGDTHRASVYLDRMGDDPRGYINRGAYHYLLGDMERAAEYFRRAADAGIMQGYANLKLLK